MSCLPCLLHFFWYLCLLHWCVTLVLFFSFRSLFVFLVVILRLGLFLLFSVFRLGFFLLFSFLCLGFFLLCSFLCLGFFFCFFPLRFALCFMRVFFFLAF